VSSEGISLQYGLPATYAHQAAEIYYQAFGAKMQPLLRSDKHGVAVIEPDLNLDVALGAVENEQLLEMAGLRFGQDRFWQPRVSSVVREVGWLTGLPRALVLMLVASGGGHPGALYIEALAVRADCRGRGIGTKLLEQSIAMARERGLREVCLDVADTNTGARRLYERMGFIAWRTRRLPPFARVSGLTALIDMKRPVD